MTKSRINFIDWMKCLGMFLIVYGHVASKTIEFTTFPIYPKQLGVAFFVFVVGWYLAQEKRDPVLVTYNRLFSIFLFGVGFAILMSAIVFFTSHDLNESNYLPFALGINVILDYFPANPTTWYIGTYIHLVLLWALALRNLKVRGWMLAVWIIAEVVIRAYLMPQGLYRAYMVLPNWGSVFLLGMFMGRRGKGDRSFDNRFFIYLLSYMVFIALWTISTRQWIAGHAFPFRKFSAVPAPFNEIVRSGFVSFLYLSHTWFVFELTRRLPGLGLVRFFSRNTLVIFIGHMPLWYAIDRPLRSMVPGYFSFVCASVIILFVGIGMGSEVITKIVKPYNLRNLLGIRLGIYARNPMES